MNACLGLRETSGKTGRARKESEDIMAWAATTCAIGPEQIPAGRAVFGSVWGNTRPADLGSRSLEPSADLDIQLVERCLAGDEGAWEDLVKVHTRRVYSICYRFVGKDSEAQDLTQEVFLRLFRTLKSFRVGEGCFPVWLTRLTRNLLIDNYRRTKQERVTDSIEEQLPMLEGRQSGANRADHLLAGREASEMLPAALQRLSPELRETVILRDLEEMEYREIAKTLGVPEGTVKSRLNRGRADLVRGLG